MSRVNLQEVEDKWAARMFEQLPFVFVYGTLKKGCGNNTLLSSSTYLGDAITEEKGLLIQMGCPYYVPAHEHDKALPILGELYQLDGPTTCRQLDRLEGYPSHYNRKVIRTTDGDHAWMYYVRPSALNGHTVVACPTIHGVYLWT